MSYPAISGYYGSSSGGQDNQRSYATNENGNSRSQQYHNAAQSVNDTPQSQYGTNAYGWAGHNQSGPVTAPNTYAHESWQTRSNTATTYNYQREQYAPAEQANTQTQSYPSRDPYNSQNTQALNSLAYASGLEPSVSSNTSNVRPSQTNTHDVYQSSAAQHNSQIRTASPASGTTRYPNTSQVPSSASHPTRHDHVNGQNLGRDAAAALAGAVRSIHPQAHQHAHGIVANRQSYSPMAGATQPTTQISARAPASTYTTTAPAERSNRTSSQSRAAANVSTQQPRSTLPNDTRPSSQVEQQHVPQMGQLTNQTQRQPVRHSPPQQITTSNPQNIANLVNSTPDGAEQVYESVESQDAMPHYIDPTQVFNPYHREHERKKKEAIVAAEVEAKRKAEEQRSEEAKRRADHEATKKASESSATANSKSKITKKVPGTTPGTVDQSLAQPASGAATPMPSEDAMAVEMQKMMAKMKELRSGNPALFQKLWNDMRGGAPGTIPSAAPIAQSASPQVMQQTLPVHPPSNALSAKPRSRKSDNATADGPPLNGYRVVTQDNPEGLPDLGRFPAERRIRNTHAKQKPHPGQGELIVFGEHGQNGTQPPDATTAQTQSAAQAAQVPQMPQVQQVTSQQRPSESNLAWPEPRRRAVAIAAVHYLKANPDNQSIDVTAQEILAMLDRNPSYLDVCTALEVRGLKFSRTAFARELLKTVPELQTPASKSAPVAKEIAAIGSSTQSQSPSLAPMSVQPTANMYTAPQPLLGLYGNTVEAMSLPPPRLQPIFTGLGSLKPEQLKPQNKTALKPPKARLPHSNRPEPPVGSKEAAARKRDFSELIDLTDIGDDENYVQPSKQPRLDPTPTPDPFQQRETTVQTSWNVNSTEPLRFNPHPQTENMIRPVPRPQPPPYQLPYAQPRVNVFQQDYQQSKAKPRVLHAQKMNKVEALQKRYYDPRTVARDILIASGRHPSERPLNLHLAVLLDGYIDLDSDVNTVDWDSIDPGGPPPPRVEYVDTLAAPPRFKLGERVRRKRAKLTDIEQTREPEEATRRAHSASRSPPPLATDASHPSSTSHTHQNGVVQKLVHRKHRSDEQKLEDDAEKLTPTTRNISIDIPLNSQRSSRSTSHQVTGPPTKMDGFNTPEVRRRGRPPGSKNKNRSVAAMKEQAKAVIVTIPPDEPPEPILHSYKCKWVKCHAELHNLETLRRHVLKIHLPDQGEIEKDGFVCWWKKCRHLKPDQDGNIVPSHIFREDKEWSQHIEEDHLQPVALKYGDGPRTKHTGKQNQIELDFSHFLYKPPVGPLTRTISHTDPQSIEAARTRYLSDANGRATTPLVTSDGNADRPPDAMVLTQVYPKGTNSEKEKADAAAQNAFMKAHGGKRDGRRTAEEVVRAMEVRKQKIGPGLDRGGCTLINEERRNTFLQAPGIARIVDAEY